MREKRDSEEARGIEREVEREGEEGRGGERRGEEGRGGRWGSEVEWAKDGGKEWEKWGK